MTTEHNATSGHIVTTREASFEDRQRLTLEGHVVEYTLSELDTLGAVADDIPVSEDDFIDAEEDGQ